MRWNFESEYLIDEALADARGVHEGAVRDHVNLFIGGAKEAIGALLKPPPVGVYVDQAAIDEAVERVEVAFDRDIAKVETALGAARRQVEGRLELLRQAPDPLAALVPSELQRANALRPSVQRDVAELQETALERRIETAIASEDRALVALFYDEIRRVTTSTVQAGDVDPIRRRSLVKSRGMLERVVDRSNASRDVQIAAATAELEKITKLRAEIGRAVQTRERATAKYLRQAEKAGVIDGLTDGQRESNLNQAAGFRFRQVTKSNG